MIYYNDTVAERLRRWTANPFPSGIASSNLVGIVFFGDVDQLVDRSLCMREVGGSKPPISNYCLISLVVERRTCNAKVGGSSPPSGFMTG